MVNPIRMKTIFVRVVPLAVLLTVTLYSRSLYADSAALEQLRTSLASAQQVLLDPKLTGAKHIYQRRKLLRIILQQLFDFDEMSRRSLGANARKYKDRLAEFTPLFVDFLEHAYMGILEANGDAKIQYIKEISDRDNVQIMTRTSLKDGSEYRVDYKLRPNTAGWRAYDVVVEGVSLVNNYRSQFDRFLNNKSFDELLLDLREKKEKFT
ncbi:MAG TPA: ABC transporter substrate-binding protein [Acidobacteriota bacterium]|nr:ABC transporter substrate-binding protein [Acidobacteriota bacterium]